MFHQYRSNSVGIYDVTIPTEKPLGPMPENPPEVGYFHFKNGGINVECGILESAIRNPVY